MPSGSDKANVNAAGWLISLAAAELLKRALIVLRADLDMGHVVSNDALHLTKVQTLF